MSTTVRTPQSVAEVVGQTLAATGVTDAFGVVGSGNLIVTNALCSQGARFHAARREDGAICMADGYARVSGHTGICSLHQGPGLTNAVTGLTEAVKSRTPLLVLAGEAPAAAPTSNFHIDQPALAASVGAASDRIKSPATAADDAQRAYQRAVIERRPVLLNVPIDIQPRPPEGTMPRRGRRCRPSPMPEPVGPGGGRRRRPAPGRAAARHHRRPRRGAGRGP